jgi:hypothetical protein
MKTVKDKIVVNNAIAGSSKIIFKLKFVWWGISQWYKWRWNEEHIDMGMLSIYNLPTTGLGKLFWIFIAFLCKPMRWYYHKYHVNYSDEKFNESFKDLSHFK